MKKRVRPPCPQHGEEEETSCADCDLAFVMLPTKLMTEFKEHLALQLLITLKQRRIIKRMLAERKEFKATIRGKGSVIASLNDVLAGDRSPPTQSP